LLFCGWAQWWEAQVDDWMRFVEAVTEMRAAQKREMDALPGNFKIWKRTRQQMTVARLEEKVDELARELVRLRPRATDAQEGDTRADRISD
jgi:hypothetical protein